MPPRSACLSTDDTAAHRARPSQVPGVFARPDGPPWAYCRPVPSTAAYARAAERVARICDERHDTRDLRLAVLGEIRRAVGFDAYAWLLTDPETEVGCAPLADVPCLPELPRLIRLKYLTSVNRWTALDAPVALLRAATHEQPERSRIWGELLADYGVRDVASVVFRDRFGCWAFLDLWRIGGAARFTAEEAVFLSDVASPVAEALRRAQARTFDLNAPVTDRRGPVVLVLSPQLEVRAQTEETEQYLRVLVPPDIDRRPVPAGAYNVAAQLLALEAGVDQHPASARVHLSGGAWVTLRAARIGGNSGADTEQDIAVTIEVTSPAERVELFARVCGLTARESELCASWWPVPTPAVSPRRCSFPTTPSRTT